MHIPPHREEILWEVKTAHCYGAFKIINNSIKVFKDTITLLIHMGLQSQTRIQTTECTYVEGPPPQYISDASLKQTKQD